MLMFTGMTEKHAHREEYPFKHYRKLRKLVRRKKADIEESAENSFNIDSINEISQDEIIQTDSEEDDTETDGFFLQPVPTKLRRTLLKTAGIKKVDLSERDECKVLRGSREQCGCDCKSKCFPDTCQCAINGIQCQVDRFSFPCGCTPRGCSNLSGRIEFNPAKVRKHYQHTMSRLKRESEMEESSSAEPENRGYSSMKKSRHIRFEENGDTVEGEVSFNSTETGCCLDCSLTTTLANGNQFDTQLSVNSCSSASESVADHQFSAFGTSFSDDVCLSPPTPSLTINPNYATDCSLEPISGLLNPILNTVDSLDMYALAHVHSSSQSQLPADSGISYSDNAVSEWQGLSHESLLTTSNLIPMHDDECNSTSDSNSTEPESNQMNVFLHNTTSPSSHLVNHNPEGISFQFPSSHEDSCCKEAECPTANSTAMSPTALQADAPVS